MPDSITIILMGTCGTGKTTIGRLLGSRLGLSYAEADDFHPAANVAKMAAGVPLDDRDREPWLDAIAQRITSASADGGLVVSCSALRRRYRDRLRVADPEAFVLHLDADRELVYRRMSARVDHYMPVSLIDSQFRALEPLGPDEKGAVLDARPAPEVVVDAALDALRLGAVALHRGDVPLLRGDLPLRQEGR